MSLPLTHADLADQDGLIATIGALLPAPAFSRTEQVVLDIAWTDAQTTTTGTSRLDRVLRYMFSAEPPLTLGSEKLEALRQYGIQLCRLGSRAVPAAATAALMAAGYSAEQISVLHMTFDAFSGRLVAASRQANR